MSASIRTSFAFAALAVAALSSAVEKQATYDFNLTPTPKSSNNIKDDMARTNWTTALGVTKFDSSLGTLKSVSIVFNWKGYIDGFLTNANSDPNEATPLTMSHTLSMLLTSANGGTVYGSETVMDLSKLDTVPTSLTGPVTYSYGGFTRDGKLTFDFGSSAANFASLFVGTGNLDLAGRAAGSFDYTFGSQDDHGHNTFAKLGGSVIYTYDAPTSSVPAPPAFLAMGAGALRVIRRRKSRAQA